MSERARRVSKSSGARVVNRLASAAAILLIGTSAALWFSAGPDQDARVRSRIDALEQRLKQMAAKAEAAQIIRESQRDPRLAAAAPRSYVIECRTPWQELGPIGQGLWGCRAPEPLPGGFYPNCNLTTSSIGSGMSPEQYYNDAVAHSSQLSAARQLGGHVIVVHGRQAYEASFEHETTGTPLRVLASMFIDGDRVYAVTCTAPPPIFESLFARFREIAGSFELKS